MTNAVVAINRPKSVTMDMADRYGMEPAAFERTLRATVFPANAPAEEFAAFLLVAKQYNLNPVTKEIYAFPKKGGGIQPIVSIDGWMNLINSHPAMDGMEFEDHHNGGSLEAITCRIYRKDRSKPVQVTEYLSECIRQTDPWKMKHRMLRHKAAIQCARYAFGFAGIVDPDEAERFEHPTPPTPPTPPAAALIPPAPPPVEAVAPAPPVPPAPPSGRSSEPYGTMHAAPENGPETGEFAEVAPDVVEQYDAALTEATDGVLLDEVIDQWFERVNGLPRAERDRALIVHEKHLARIGNA